MASISTVKRFGLLLLVLAAGSCSGPASYDSLFGDDLCVSQEDCEDGRICVNGYCVPDPGGDFDFSTDGDDPDGDVPTDGDDPDGDSDFDPDMTPFSCQELSGMCVGDDNCPEGMRPHYDPAGCAEPKPMCCLPESETLCELYGGYCEGAEASACYRPGYGMNAQDPMGCDEQGGFCCLPTTDCVPDGEVGTFNQDVCCPGLIQIGAVFLADENDIHSNCIDAPCDCFVCSRCGNGVCGAGESHCNCEADCPPPQTYCTTDADCGESYCEETVNGQCLQYDPSCEQGACHPNMGSHESSLCLVDTCAPFACQMGDLIYHDCWDGSQVVVCECLGGGGWKCEEDPDSLCPEEPECGVGQEIPFQCPTGEWVTDCVCEGGECKPFCDNIGTRQEGWYDSCGGGLLSYALCGVCQAQCRRMGSAEEGWYDACTGQALRMDACTPHWECADNPLSQCRTDPTQCENLGGYCAAEGEICPPTWAGSTDALLGCPFACCLPNVDNDCERNEGFCSDASTGCPLGSKAVEMDCSGSRTCCIAEFPFCNEAGGSCFDPEYACPPGWFPASGVPFVCADGGFCCFPEETNPCTDAGGVCSYANQGCPVGHEISSLNCGDDDSICCMPSGENECERWGGYCESYANPCAWGFTDISYPAGCLGSERCCIPEGPNCYDDSDCGESSCYEYGWVDAEDPAEPWPTTCVETYPYCEDGYCGSYEEIHESSSCIDGRCLPYPAYCSDIGGACYWQCPDGTVPVYEDSFQDCGQRYCCVPMEASCEEAGGFCIGWGPQCPSDTYVDWEHPCEYGQCCMPYEEPECYVDSDCGRQECYTYDSDYGACTEAIPYCEGGRCAYYEIYFDNAACGPDGQCYEIGADCQDAGGTCFLGLASCPQGYESRPGEWECNYNAICCFEENTVYDCDRIGGFCSGYGQGCPPYTEYEPNGACPVGEGSCCREVAPNYCEDMGGFCSGYNQPCPPGTQVEYDYWCADGGGNCCVPMEENICEMEGGVCFDNNYCPDDMEPVYLPCGDTDGLCCIPREVNECEDMGGFCRSYNYACPSGYEDAPYGGCNEGYARCCAPAETVECEEQGGYCSRPTNGCRDGYQPMNDSMGCEYPNRLCCLRGGNFCSSDRDCGESKCDMDADGGCVQYYPYCGEDGICREETETMYPAFCDGEWCVPGECMPGDEQWHHCPDGLSFPWCWCTEQGTWDCMTDDPDEMCGPVEVNCEDDLNGYCGSWGSDCLEGFVEEPDAVCDGFCIGGCKCCAPDPNLICTQLGGYCNMSFGGCDNGYIEAPFNAGCPNIFGFQIDCCVPGLFPMSENPDSVPTLMSGETE